MRIVSMILILTVVLMSGCASMPQQIPETMKRTCELYQTVKPQVSKLRAYAKSNWAAIPPDVQKVLLELDGVLPELDRAGQLICAASTVTSGGIRAFTQNVDWDRTLAIVVKAAATAADLKVKGVI